MHPKKIKILYSHPTIYPLKKYNRTSYPIRCNELKNYKSFYIDKNRYLNVYLKMIDQAVIDKTGLMRLLDQI